MVKKQKWYTVWVGKAPGVYTSWEECREQTHGIAGARYKSFATEAEARLAFEQGAPERKTCAQKATTEKSSPFQNTLFADVTDFIEEHTQLKPVQEAVAAPTVTDSPSNPPEWRTDTVLPLPEGVHSDAIAVDAACSGNPGNMEYRGIDLRTGAEVFHVGPMWATNNIGEFLAIVHALAFLEKEDNTHSIIYSDSRTAQLWVRRKECRSLLKETDKSRMALSLVKRATLWLHAHGQPNNIVKWDTDKWGEIPADFGRK